MGPSLETVNGVVEEIMRIHRSLPARPSVDEVEAATVLIDNVEREEQIHVDAISKQKKASDIPDELFFILREMQKNSVSFQCKEQKREAFQLLDLYNIHILFDEMIQTASACLPLASNGSVSSISMPSSSMSSIRSSTSDSKGSFSSFIPFNGSDKELARTSERITRDDSYVKKAKSAVNEDGYGGDLNLHRGLLNSVPTSRSASISEEDTGKLSLIKLASLIETFAKNGTRNLNLKNKLMDQVVWIPDSIGKLFGLETLDLSENRLVAFPTTVSGLTSLTKLDLHSNKIAELPDSIGDLISLLYLNLFGNQLTSLPTTIGKLQRLQELDLSSNRLLNLPDAIGDLVNLKKLNVETNNLEEFPYTIGNCISLEELRADYNRIKALPEAIGKLESLQVLTVRYNNISRLPTTMASLTKLMEVDASFNELESIPESLCLVTSLTKLNIGNNFANLLSLPRSIGNLEMLEELDVSNNQIRVLPDSFGNLSQLRLLHAEENPLEVPPRQIAEKGAQAAVKYMAELVTERCETSQETKTKNIWTDCCFFSSPAKIKSDGGDYTTRYSVA
ncbi:plant intracellular Ras-group-related LRR protein 4 [Phalaenopsis equestris]|uniref:plant intracellular Ras-group-related LRR protein 4 n=1 Tax=Phalaenopsis equestris TaxID=78828 RepID=UPI0009E4AB96|nr:plant intracellular Ras-group-related LRR protein 4 [Phalaenopsis equestris]XP_020579011.1 plant intracellular Ras-group-related LRR protein 4 [Phalaenopsis equestris]XP_020579012.1 plant intracellular Ras-group-related LRR protein 4 [Phalaenopsis equestris]XP_020579013.1 plant intracellular Ras-group-related LRR protein 4 [Phalaenopsis equestris]